MNENSRKVLILSPHFPPSSLPPSHRVRLYVKHLHSLGWWPVVITVNPSRREDTPDPWMDAIVGDAFEKHTMPCLSQRLTRFLGFGDLGLRLLPFLVPTLVSSIRRHRPDVLLLPVPPWYVLLAAPIVKRLTGVPYVIDFIDPWFYEAEPKGFKAKATLWIARKMEGFVTVHSSGILAVSMGIIEDLARRHPSVKRIPSEVLPYGVELSDYEGFKRSFSPARTRKLVRYIGAVSDAMKPVVRTVLEAFRELEGTQPLQIEFIGTSYAGGGLARPAVAELIEQTGCEGFVSEKPARVGYSDALKLTAESDLLLLIGDTTRYYAASKLMGLIASGRPFIAFTHNESVPCEFLSNRAYPFLVSYGDGADGPASRKNLLKEVLSNALSGEHEFRPIETSDPSFVEHTAYGMTIKLCEILKKATDA